MSATPGLLCFTPGCGHLHEAHKASGECRIGGCYCTAYSDGRPPARPGTRRVSVDVPEGYAVSFQLTPFLTSLAPPRVEITPEEAREAEEVR